MRDAVRVARRAALAGALATPALAQPARSVRLVVPFPGGGTMDAQARLFAPHLGARLGANVVVDNRPGAGTVIGTQEAARAAPDGGTILMLANSFTINPTLHGNLPYEIFRDFVPLALTSIIPHAFVVHPSVPARTVAEFVALARARPGALSYASYGTGTSNHLNTELLARAVRAELTHVPYRGFVQWFPDLLQSRVQFTIANLPEVVPAVRDGRLRALAAAHETRVPALPETPTLAEAGVAGITSNSWFGVVAPAGVPTAFRMAAEAALVETLALPEVRAKLEELWITPLGQGAAPFAEWLRREQATYAEAIRLSGAQPE